MGWMILVLVMIIVFTSLDEITDNYIKIKKSRHYDPSKEELEERIKKLEKELEECKKASKNSDDK